MIRVYKQRVSRELAFGFLPVASLECHSVSVHVGYVLFRAATRESRKRINKQSAVLQFAPCSMQLRFTVRGPLIDLQLTVRAQRKC